MIVSFPILLENGGTTGRAIFVPDVRASHGFTIELFAKLRHSLWCKYNDSCKIEDHGTLFPLTFSPAIRCRRFSGECHLRRRTLKVDLPVLSFTAFGRPMTLLPHLDDLLLPLNQSEHKGEVLCQALTRYFRDIEKSDPESLPSMPLILGPKAFVDYLLVDVPLAETLPKVTIIKDFSLFGVSRVGDGATELRKNGSSLGDRWPSGLARAYYREKETDQLRRLLTMKTRKPILLVGMRKAGKTAIFEEAVFKILESRPAGERHLYKKGFWRIHTNRLMAGMANVGDWQKRIMAIAEYAEFWDETLLFENFAALFHLGRSAGSRLCMADVLRPFLEKQRFRFVAEATEETLARLRELDRTFCDLFEIVRVREVDRPTALRILIGGTRDIESKYPVNLDAAVVPLAESLQRRFNRREALVGGILDFLRDLASKVAEGNAPADERDFYGRTPLGRKDVLQHFSRLSGFSLEFLDTSTRRSREEIREALGKQWIGQEAAVDALTDTIVVARAGIQDPTKPYGSFLFLGPTGVGKTECAKGLARYLYGDTERLLRFDMNEFVSPGSAVRLCGSPDAPEGLLTSAVRQQPFAVVLFDEIEKAHPDVYDLLLQVMGEGRLSDALGRTVDFTNTIVLLTSNLGVREAARSTGFGGGDDSGQAYLDAARRFFRPEFYNRLDAVIPFRSLTRGEIARINQRLLDAFFDRPGFMQRHTSLRLTPEAEEWLTDKGYDPVFGARALKRVIEDTLANPVAAALARHPPTAPVVMDVDVAGDGLATEANVLAEAPPVEVWRPAVRKQHRLSMLDACARHVSEIMARISHIDDPPFTYRSGEEKEGLEETLEGFTPAARLRDLRDDIGTLRMDIEDESLRASLERLKGSSRPALPVPRTFWRPVPMGLSYYADLFNADDLNLFLDDLFSKPVETTNKHTAEGIFEELVHLDHLTDVTSPEAHWLMLYDNDLEAFLGSLLEEWSPPLDASWLSALEQRGLAHRFFRGRGSENFLRPFVGTYMEVFRSSGATRTRQCALFPVPRPEEAASVLRQRLAERHPLGPFAPLIFVLRGNQALDLRTGRTGEKRSRAFLRHHLECPQTLKEKLHDAGL